MRSATLLALLPLALAAPSKRASPAPVIQPRGASLIEGKYIIKMKSTSQTSAVENAVSAIAADADYRYSNRFNGFAATLTPEELQKLQNDPNVEYIEQDAIVTIKATQEDATWGLARLSSQKPGGTTYTYDDSAGEGTCAFIIDTGIEADHPEFEGRATFLENFTGDGIDKDGQGHGTHVAGTIGSKTYGVAKKTTIFSVKVLDSQGSGTNAGVIKGMDYVTSEAKTKDCPKGVVVNMSLGGQTSASVNEAAANIVNAGLFLAVAAGNEASDASTSSPASEPLACTVGATDKDDVLAEYSNFGKLVDVLAPGTDITSTWLGGKTNTISGTSMATPHVVGLGAYLLGLGKDVKDLCSTIAGGALKDVIQSVPDDTVNLLINNGEGSA